MTTLLVFAGLLGYGLLVLALVRRGGARVHRRREEQQFAEMLLAVRRAEQSIQALGKSFAAMLPAMQRAARAFEAFQAAQTDQDYGPDDPRLC